MFSAVHIDEKWFFQTKKSEMYYQLSEETDHVPTCKSKRFITKVIFFVVVASLIFADDDNILFDD